MVILRRSIAQTAVAKQKQRIIHRIATNSSVHPLSLEPIDLGSNAQRSFLSRNMSAKLKLNYSVMLDCMD